MQFLLLIVSLSLLSHSKNSVISTPLKNVVSFLLVQRFLSVYVSFLNSVDTIVDFNILGKLVEVDAGKMQVNEMVLTICSYIHT